MNPDFLDLLREFVEAEVWACKSVSNQDASISSHRSAAWHSKPPGPNISKPNSPVSIVP